MSRVLKALDCQTINAASWELLIIDNASCPPLNPDHLEVAHCQLRVVYEANLGLSQSRRRGVMEANGRYVVFVDDDNILADNYLELSLSIMDEHPTVGVLGGRSHAESSIPIPPWFHSYASDYAVGVQAIESGDITERRYLWGAGSVLRTAELRKIFESGVESCLSDRRGNELLSGGDSEICRWFIMLGYKLWYDDRLFFIHYMHPSRLTVDYFRRLIAGHAMASRMLSAYDAVLDCPDKFSSQWWKLSIANLYHMLATFGRLGNWRMLEALDLLPFVNFHNDVRVAKTTARAVRALKACPKTLR